MPLRKSYQLNGHSARLEQIFQVAAALHDLLRFFLQTHEKTGNKRFCLLIIRLNDDNIIQSEKEWQPVLGHCHSFYANFVAMQLQKRR